MEHYFPCVTLSSITFPASLRVRKSLPTWPSTTLLLPARIKAPQPLQNGPLCPFQIIISLRHLPQVPVTHSHRLASLLGHLQFVIPSYYGKEGFTSSSVAKWVHQSELISCWPSFNVKLCHNEFICLTHPPCHSPNPHPASCESPKALQLWSFPSAITCSAS